MTGASKLAKRIANIMPSGNAGLITLINITVTPIINP